MDKVKPKGNVDYGSGIWMRVVSFLLVFCILASLAIVMEGRIFGVEVRKAPAKDDVTAAVTHTGDATVVNTTELGKGMTGYAGPVPVEIYITAGRVDSIVPLPNAESPGFFSRLKSEGLTSAWDGRTVAEAVAMEVDAISGATYSSNALIGNVRAGLRYVCNTKSVASHGHSPVSAATWVALAVIACGAVLPFFIHDRRYRIVQQLLNVGVLGFWAGTFIDYAMMLNFMGNGFTSGVSFIVVVSLLVVGFIYPLAGRGGHYCAWICPFGSLQELAGDVCKKKIHLSPRLVKGLDTFRQILWVVLLVFLYAGIGTAWIDNEVFTAFLVESASWTVIWVGVLFVVLSLFIPRPFCRFVCPTGSLLKDA